MKVVARFAGIVAYNDNSHQQFAGHLDDKGNIALNSGAEGRQAVYRVQNDKNWLEDMLALLSGTVTLSPAAVAAKTVTDLTAEISGHVAFDDNTHGGFIVQYTKKAGAHIPSGGDVDNWTRALQNSSTLQRLIDLFDVIAGNATITP